MAQMRQQLTVAVTTALDLGPAKDEYRVSGVTPRLPKPYRLRFLPTMAIAPYTLRLSPPPPLDAPLLPHLRPYLRRRGSAKVAAASTSWAPAAAGESDDGVRGWSLPEHERPEEQGRRNTGKLIVSRQATSR